MGLRRHPRATASLALLAALAIPGALAPAAQADEVDPAAPGGTSVSTTAPTESPTGQPGQTGPTESTADGAADSAAGVRAGSPLRTVIPLPRVTVSRVCGARDDILTVDPAWLARWGDKVVIFPNSLLFQGGTDAELAKPSGMIKAEFRSAYRWVGSHGTEWASWLLYPGTVKPVVDRNVPCPASVEAPQLTRAVMCGPQNDEVTFADDASAEHWRIAARRWNGTTQTVSLKARRGYVGPGGATELEQDFIDTGDCAAS